MVALYVARSSRRTSRLLVKEMSTTTAAEVVVVAGTVAAVVEVMAITEVVVKDRTTQRFRTRDSELPPFVRTESREELQNHTKKTARVRAECAEKLYAARIGE